MKARFCAFRRWKVEPGSTCRSAELQRVSSAGAAGSKASPGAETQKLTAARTEPFYHSSGGVGGGNKFHFISAQTS